MARVHNNIFVRGLSGAVGDQFVIKTTRSGKTIVANMPTFDEDRVFSEAQMSHQSAFREASAYARSAKAQAVYVERANATNSRHLPSAAHTGSLVWDLAAPMAWGVPAAMLSRARVALQSCEPVLKRSTDSLPGSGSEEFPPRVRCKWSCRSVQGTCRKSSSESYSLPCGRLAPQWISERRPVPPDR